ncbi:glycosyl hydrolase, partial [Bacteroides thetaiotaomicron]
AVNPSGRTADTWVTDNLSAPAANNFRELQADGTWAANSFHYSNVSDNPDVSQLLLAMGEDTTVRGYFNHYAEGIYVGYKYYETRHDTEPGYNYKADVAYPFGHGLSYTTWAYSNFQVAEDGDNFVVTLDVTNTGSVPGKHSVLVYLQSPYTDYDKLNGIEKAAVTLVGFTKTGMLDGGASESVTVEVPKWQLRSYDANNAKTYILDAGSYYLTAAGSSHEAVNNILAKKGFGNTDSAGNTDMVYEYQVAALDTEIFSKSYATGNSITNLFECADPNKDAAASQTNSVTWVSRSDWEGTLPAAAQTIRYNDDMVEQARPISYVADPARQAETEMPRFGVANGLTLAAFMD